MALSPKLQELKDDMDLQFKKLMMSTALSIEEYNAGKYDRAVILTELSVDFMRDMVRMLEPLKHKPKKGVDDE